MTRIRTSLENHVPSSPDPDKTCHLRRAAFREQNIAIIHLDKVVGWDVRQIIVNEAKKQLGL